MAVAISIGYDIKLTHYAALIFCAQKCSSDFNLVAFPCLNSSMAVTISVGKGTKLTDSDSSVFYVKILSYKLNLVPFPCLSSR